MVYRKNPFHHKNLWDVLLENKWHIIRSRIMIKYKAMEEKDPNLQAPQEANTTKHINFLELEENSDNSGSKSQDEDSATKKAWEELREDNKKKDDNTGNS